MPNSYVVVVPWEGGTCVPSKPEIEQQLRYGLVVRIPGSHPGGPGSIPGNGKCFPAKKERLSSLYLTFRIKNL